MSTSAPQPPGAVRKVADALRTELLTRANLRLLLGVAAVGVLGLFGGFDAVDSDTPRHALTDVVGEPLTADPVEVVLTGTGTTLKLVGEEFPTLEMTVTNTGTRPVDGFALARILDWQGQEESTYATTQRPDGSSAGTLNPGVPVDLALIVPAGPDPVLVLNSVTWRVSNLDGSEQFFDPVPVAEVTL